MNSKNKASPLVWYLATSLFISIGSFAVASLIKANRKKRIKVQSVEEKNTNNSKKGKDQETVDTLENQKQLTIDQVRSTYAMNNRLSIPQDIIEQHGSFGPNDIKAENSHVKPGAIFEEYGESWASADLLNTSKKIHKPNPASLSDKNFWVPLLADRSMPCLAEMQGSEEKEAPRNFTLEQLAHYNGQTEGLPILIALKKDVFDVSTAVKFYGKDGQFNKLAGHDASANLAKLSYSDEHLNCMDLSPLTKKEKLSLETWYKNFKYYKEYPLKGRIVELPQPIPITLEEMSKIDGNQEIPEGFAAAPIWVGIRGQVFDVSFGGVQFYSKGTSYHIFAGKDVTRALAKMSFLENDIGSPQLDDLSEQEKTNLGDWEKTFLVKKKYPIVGYYNNTTFK